MKCLKDVYGDDVYINEQQIQFIENKNKVKSIYKVYFANGLDRSFPKEEITKLIKEEDK